MNEILLTLGIESWKPLATALILPPLPFIVLVLAGARLMFRRRLLAWLLVLIGALGMYFCTTMVVGRGLTFWLLQQPRALSETDISDLKRAPKTAIMVLGGGRRLLAPEYGMSSLHPRTTERLRYGIWLSRETGLPLGYTGGLGRGAAPGPSEAEIAARVAEREFGRPLRWQESESRDTRENAFKTVALLKPQGIEQIVLVTHGYHMRRTMANFERAAEGSKIRIVAAPMGLYASGRLEPSDWVPSIGGFEATWIALHEWLGWVAGA